MVTLNNQCISIPSQIRPILKIMHLIPIILFLISSLLFSCNTAVNKTDSAHKINPPEKRYPLLVSTDCGVSWESVSDGLPENLQVSFIEQKGHEIVIASDNMGIYLSSENKSNWKLIGEELPNNKINALHISEENIYAGVYREGIFVTVDEGMTWTSINYDLPNLRVQTILKLGNQLVIGTDEGLFMLSDNTNHWKETDIKSQVLSIYEYDGRLVAGTNQGTLFSVDIGNHWEWIRKEGAVHYTHNIRHRIIELVLTGDIVYSDDWGATWNTTQYEPRKGSYVYEIIQCGKYQLISNNYGIHRSKDKGVSWEHIFKTESMAFFDLIAVGDKIYGGTRAWDEFRKRN